MAIDVDPGIDGGIVVLNDSVIAGRVMPTLKYPNSRGRIMDTRRVSEFLETAAVVSERQHVLSRPKQGVTSMFTLGKSVGVLEGVCVAMRVPFEFVDHRQWERAMFARTPHKDTKAASILKAGQLYPIVSLLPSDRCSKLHDGMADSLMIATYGKRVLAGEGASSRKIESAN